MQNHAKKSLVDLILIAFSNVRAFETLCMFPMHVMSIMNTYNLKLIHMKKHFYLENEIADALTRIFIDLRKQMVVTLSLIYCIAV